jgi:NAD(P)-dependent dehydrogenase (short-subunit alcohol dehydrogenase family)
MKVSGKVIVVTGGATGIGRAMVRRFHAEGARAIVVADLDGEGAVVVANEVGGLGLTVDVSRETEVTQLVQTTLDRFGSIDLFCSNAGILTAGGEETPTSQWQRSWDVNVMAHVFAARAVLPGMLERGSGYLLSTASAAGLLSHPSATYSVSKHAVIGFAEWLSITYGDRGIKASALCPQGVVTDMLLGKNGERQSFLLDGALSPEQVAEAVVQGLDAETFLILPHPEVATYFQRKAGDYERWLRGMRRLSRPVG